MISIALATYNGEKYLCEQLDSILAQTMQDFELVVCDDCSSDTTPKILAEYASKDSRIRVYINEYNLGFIKNFEKAISLCMGEYIALSDQDDIWKPFHLEKLYSIIGENSCAFANSELIDANGISKNMLLSELIGVDFYEETKILFRQMLSSSIFYGHNSLFRADVLRRFMPVPTNVRFHDVWFSTCAVCSGEGVSFDFTPITLYRIHGKNTGGKHNSISFTERIKLFFMPEAIEPTDRFIYHETIIERGICKSKEQKEILDKCLIVLSCIFQGRCFFKAFSLFIKDYKYIYHTNSKRLFLFRIFTFVMRQIRFCIRC